VRTNAWKSAKRMLLDSSQRWQQQQCCSGRKPAHFTLADARERQSHHPCGPAYERIQGELGIWPGRYARSPFLAHSLLLSSAGIDRELLPHAHPT